jgi:D-alanyl-lipoteichoic acid acyltransferase DltB (MBOAT superfamily)
MLFHTPQYAVFLAVVLALSGLLIRHRKTREAMLLVASWIFYAAWNIKYLGLILFSTVLDFVIGAEIYRSDSPRYRKLLLTASLVGNLSLLGVFKYYGFFVENIDALLQLFGLHPSLPALKVILPVGISFYTFQSMSYTIDIYRGELEPRQSLMEFALFVAFFPQLVAGPIVRAREFLPQLDRAPGATSHQTGTGIYLILKGLIKKVLIGDILAVYLVDPVFANPAGYGALAIAAAIYGFRFQIYNDFSGYSDIAIGTGRLLGFEFPINFRSPFKASSITDYWRRWHITMGRWFRDYVFFPLGGSKGGLGRICIITFITMGLVGLWHGAEWTFVLWGCYHGVLLILSIVKRHVSARLRPGAPAGPDTWSPVGLFLRVAIVFHLTMLAGLIFRAPDLATIGGMLSRMWHLLPGPAVDLRLVALIVLAFGLHFVSDPWKEGIERWFANLHPLLQGAAIAVVIWLLVTVAGQTRPYYYFQF